jgi:hypothetical protein
MEMLKNNQSKINNSIFQINITIESLVKRVSGTEDRVEELD